MPENAKPKTYAAESGIHGMGLFAGEKIPKDTLIVHATGKPTKTNDMHVLWITDEDGEVRGTRITNKVRFVNHAPKPNADFFELELWSIRTIEKGDEITANYGADWDDLG